MRRGWKSMRVISRSDTAPEPGALEEKEPKGSLSSSSKRKSMGTVERQRLDLLRGRDSAMKDDIKGFVKKANLDEAGAGALAHRCEHFKDLFMDFDGDISGDIDQMELQRLFEKVGETKTHLELKKLVVKYGSNGTISFPQFLHLMTDLGAGTVLSTPLVEKKVKSPKSSDPSSDRSSPRRSSSTASSSSSSKLKRKNSSDSISSSSKEKGDGEKASSPSGERRRPATMSSQASDALRKQIAAREEAVALADGLAQEGSSSSSRKKRSSSSKLKRSSTDQKSESDDSELPNVPQSDPPKHRRESKDPSKESPRTHSKDRVERKRRESKDDVERSSIKKSSSSSSLSRKRRESRVSFHAEDVESIPGAKPPSAAEDDHAHGLACLGGVLHAEVAKTDHHDHDHKHGAHHHDDDKHDHPHNFAHKHDHHGLTHTEEELSRMSNSELLRDREYHDALEALTLEEFVAKGKQSSDKKGRTEAELEKYERALHKRHQKVKEREQALIQREAVFKKRAKKKLRELAELEGDVRTFQLVVQAQHKGIKVALNEIHDEARREKLEAIVPIDPADDPILCNYDVLDVIRAQRAAKVFIMRRRAARLMELVARIKVCDDSETRRVRRRNAVVKEIFTTEQSYVNSLKNCLENYYKPLELEVTTAKEANREPLIKKSELNAIFGDLHILVLLNQEFLRDLDSKINNTDVKAMPPRLSEAFQRIAPLLQIYSRYVSNYGDAVKTLQEMREARPELAAYLTQVQQERDPNGLALGDYLIMPVQRPMRYQMLLDEVIKNTPAEHVELEDLKAANRTITSVVIGINESKRAAEEHSEFAKTLANQQQSARRGALGLSKSKAKTVLNLGAGITCKLAVKLIRGKELLAMDSNGKSDPFAKVIQGEEFRKSQIIKKTLEPEWNEMFAMVVAANEPLLVEVWDWDRVGGDDFIGEVSIPLMQFLNKPAETRWFALQTKEGGPAGQVELEIKLV